jgi:hypothetical protein
MRTLKGKYSRHTRVFYKVLRKYFHAVEKDPTPVPNDPKMDPLVPDYGCNSTLHKKLAI